MHGLVGYTFALPGHDGLLNALRWDTAADPLDVQPMPTVFERATDAGVDVAHVALRSFEGSGLTRAALRGARYPGADTVGEAVQVTAQTLRTTRTLAGLRLHRRPRQRRAHPWVRVRRLACPARAGRPVRPAAAPRPAAGRAAAVTADHGMVDVGPTARVDFDSEPLLSAGVRLLGGEPRARHVYARDGAAADVLSAWRERLGETAQVLSRDEAVARGWFGPQVASAVLPRIGDVVVAPTGPTAVVASRMHPREARLVGYHGSTTADEVLVPLLRAGG